VGVEGFKTRRTGIQNKKSGDIFRVSELKKRKSGDRKGQKKVKDGLTMDIHALWKISLRL